mmetsp:Transcript_6294/g.18728  ORF Transcript_6294/g.18728 Transcript_6294/m.18728 type:complete len:168 (+) Transcript_6294:738-1241(+)
MPSASASSLDQSSPDPSESSSKRSSGSGASNASSPSGGSGPVTRVEACMAYEVAHGVEVRLPVPSKGRGDGVRFQHKQGVDARLRERLHTALRVAPHRRLALALDQQPARHGDGGRHAASALRERRVRQPYPLGLSVAAVKDPREGVVGLHGRADANAVEPVVRAAE